LISKVIQLLVEGGGSTKAFVDATRNQQQSEERFWRIGAGGA